MIERLKYSLREWLALAIVALALGVVATTAHATTVIAPTFEQMTDKAELIFVGKVVSARSEWRNVGARRVIFTQVEFERQEVIKGEAGPSVTLQFLGGKVGEVSMEVDGVPKFNVGDRELLFVKGNGVQFSPVVGVFHGKFGVRKDQKSGREILVRHNGKELRDVTEIGAGAEAREESGLQKAEAELSNAANANALALSLDDFKSKIRERLAASSASKK